MKKRLHIIFVLTVGVMACQKNEVIRTTQATPSVKDISIGTEAIAKAMLNFIDNKVIIESVANIVRYQIDRKGDEHVGFDKLDNSFHKLLEQATRTNNLASEYLKNNKVEVYWPFYEEWDKTTTPTITFQPLNSTTEGIGFVKNGSSFTKVLVNEEYAAKHPVWIIENAFPELELKSPTQTVTNTRTSAQKIIRIRYVKLSKDMDEGLFSDPVAVKLGKVTRRLIFTHLRQFTYGKNIKVVMNDFASEATMTIRKQAKVNGVQVGTPYGKWIYFPMDFLAITESDKNIVSHYIQVAREGLMEKSTTIKEIEIKTGGTVIDAGFTLSGSYNSGLTNIGISTYFKKSDEQNYVKYTYKMLSNNTSMIFAGFLMSTSQLSSTDSKINPMNANYSVSKFLEQSNPSPDKGKYARFSTGNMVEFTAGIY